MPDGPGQVRTGPEWPGKRATDSAGSRMISIHRQATNSVSKPSYHLLLIKQQKETATSSSAGRGLGIPSRGTMTMAARPAVVRAAAGLGCRLAGAHLTRRFGGSSAAGGGDPAAARPTGLAACLEQFPPVRHAFAYGSGGGRAWRRHGGNGDSTSGASWCCSVAVLLPAGGGCETSEVLDGTHRAAATAPRRALP